MTDELDKTPIWGESGDRTLPSENDPAAKPADGESGPPGVDLTAGSVLAGRYRIISRLGKGGMGEVYRAEDTKLDLPVALKFLPPEFAADTERHAQLFAEIKVARKISHPNVCRVYDLGETGGVYFLSMEYIDGEDLKSLLHRIGRLPWAKSIELGRQICEGLAAAHEAGVLHRDLKPANLMIDGEGRARLTDFGLAALADSAGAGMAGTPLYMAPEQFSGRPASVASDLYALGLVLYELFTGRRVIDASSLSEAMKLHQQGTPTPPSEIRVGFDPTVEAMILGCLEKDPAERPESAAEVATAMVEGVGARLAEGARIATLLLSELIGASGVLERSGDATSAELFQKHDRIARDLLEEHGGREIDKSEGFLLLFDRPLQAVLYALDYHRALAELSRVEGVELEARVGIHLGEIVLRRNSGQDVARGAKVYELEGVAKPTAARLMSAGRGRQTLMTQAAFDLARRGALGSAEGAQKLQWLAHGSYEFQGAEEPVEVFEVGLERVAPLAAPESSETVTRLADEDTILGWRPAPGLEIPHRSKWLVKEKLGEGGFGEVWLGEQKKTGEQRVFKFCYEAERLQSLKREITVFRLLKEEIGLRADIARILDWNLDEAPYFVEFVHVEGGSLVDWAKHQGGIGELPLADRLEIVAQVATALAAAHSVGVLHKDIKPANVLMAEDAEGQPQAVLTDFGIGLVTDQQRLAAQGFTVLGMTEVDLATGGGSTTGTQIYIAPELLAGKTPTIQADIYALGVMLYQVSVGDLDRPLAQGWDRHIEDEILREDIAACVEGNPSRRPGSAGEVAERLRTLEERRAARQAEEQAVRDAERAQRRRKLLTTVAAVSSVFLVVVSFLAVQAMRARSDAERRRGQAEELIDFMLNDLYEGLDKIGRLDLLAEVASSSKQYFDSLAERDESPDSLEKRGRTLQNIGGVMLDQNKAEPAVAIQEVALSLFEKAVAGEPSNDRWRLGLALSRLRLGEALSARGDTDSALEAYREALPPLQLLAKEGPESPEPLFALAQAHYSMAALEFQIGNSAAVVEAANSAVQILEQHSASGSSNWRHSLLLLDGLQLLGRVHLSSNEPDQALLVMTKFRDIAVRLSKEDPANTYWPRRLAVGRELIGKILYQRGEREAALASFEAASAAYRTLIRTDPTRLEWRRRLTNNSMAIGYVHSEAGDFGVALEKYRESQAILEQLVAEDPSRVASLFRLAFTHEVIFDLQLATGDLASAEQSIVTALDLRERIATASGDDPGPQHYLSLDHMRLGDVSARRKNLDLARKHWSRAVALIEPVTRDTDESMYLDTHAQALLRLERVEEARPLVEKLLARGWAEQDFLRAVRDSGLKASLP